MVSYHSGKTTGNSGILEDKEAVSTTYLYKLKTVMLGW